jgi:hypothetical protein
LPAVAGGFPLPLGAGPLVSCAKLRFSAAMSFGNGHGAIGGAFTGNELTAPGPQHIEPTGEMVDGLLGRPALAVEQGRDQDGGGSEPEDRDPHPPEGRDREDDGECRQPDSSADHYLDRGVDMQDDARHGHGDDQSCGAGEQSYPRRARKTRTDHCSKAAVDNYAHRGMPARAR